jgi:NAD(P)-dependent dehydrogenase (short-subunit alcohol dehydrogenase family)
LNRVEGKVAIVTGGAQGLGRAIAELLGSEGARVVITDLEQRGHRAAYKASEGGVRVNSVHPAFVWGPLLEE